MELIKQVWWKRVGFWLGTLWALLSASRLWDGMPAFGWWGWDAVFLPLFVFTAIHGWRQGVVADDRGIRVRRLSRRRHARWSEIERFDDKRGAVAILQDGTKLRLFDWLGDTERVVALLEDERQRHVTAACDPMTTIRR